MTYKPYLITLALLCFLAVLFPLATIPSLLPYIAHHAVFTILIGVGAYLAISEVLATRREREKQEREAEAMRRLRDREY